MNGIDISHYQQGLDLAKAKAGGVEFAILKLSEGRTIQDSSFDGFFSQADACGLPVGAYVYSHAVTPSDAIAEAQYAIQLLKGRKLPLGLYMDVECYTQMALPKQQLRDTVRAFIEAVKAAGYVSGLYGSEYNLWTRVDPDDCGDTIVWVAHYGKQPDCPCDIWQSSDKGSISGYSGPVDQDVARSERFKALVRGNCSEIPNSSTAPATQEQQSDVILLQLAMQQDGYWPNTIDGLNTASWREAFRAFAGDVLGVEIK